MSNDMPIRYTEDQLDFLVEEGELQGTFAGYISDLQSELTASRDEVKRLREVLSETIGDVLNGCSKCQIDIGMTGQACPAHRKIVSRIEALEQSHE